MEFLFQRGAGGGDLGEEFFVFGQEVVHVARAGVRVVRVLEVEVIVGRFDLVDRNALGLLIFYPVVPPSFLRLELLNTDRFALVVAFGTRRIWVLVIPDFGCGLAFSEEEEIRANTGVGIEDAIG